MFPFYKTQKTMMSHNSEVDSVGSSGSRMSAGKKRRIGGMARRKVAR